jgi:hypothetical protein
VYATPGVLESELVRWISRKYVEPHDALPREFDDEICRLPKTKGEAFLLPLFEMGRSG